jgi:diguanylate cyclase (GGDEF)-like protein
MVARYGGDEFIIILRDIKSANGLTLLLEKLRDAMEAPILHLNKTFQVGASLGKSLFPQDSNDLEELLRIADTHMYQNKRKRKEKR